MLRVTWWIRVVTGLVWVTVLCGQVSAGDASSGPSQDEMAKAMQQLDVLRQHGQVVVNPALGALDPAKVKTDNPLGSTNPPNEGWDELKKLFTPNNSKKSSVVNGVQVSGTMAPGEPPARRPGLSMTPQQMQALQQLIALKAQQPRMQGVLELGEDKKARAPHVDEEKSEKPPLDFTKDPMDALPPTETNLMRGATLAAASLGKARKDPAVISPQEKATMVDSLARYTKKGFGSFLKEKNGKVLKFGYYRIGGVQDEASSSETHEKTSNVELPAAAMEQAKAMVGGAVDSLPLPAEAKNAIKQAASGEPVDVDSLMKQAQLQAIAQAQAAVGPHLDMGKIAQLKAIAAGDGVATNPLAAMVGASAPAGAKLMAALQSPSGGVDTGKMLALKALQKSDGSINAALLGVVETAVDPATGQLDPQKVQNLVVQGKLPVAVAQSLMTASALSGKPLTE